MMNDTRNSDTVITTSPVSDDCKQIEPLIQEDDFILLEQKWFIILLLLS